MSRKDIASIFEKTLHDDRQYGLQAEAQLAKAEREDQFVPALLGFIGDESFKIEIRLAASIRFKNLIKYRWPENSSSLLPPLNSNDRDEIKNNLINFIMKQTDPRISALLYVSTSFIINEDYPERWPKLVDQSAHALLNTNNPVQILHCINLLRYIFAKYRYSMRHTHNPIEDIIEKTFPIFSKLIPSMMTVYMNNSPKPLDKQNMEENKYNSNLLILRILKSIFRIFFFSLQMNFPRYLQKKEVYVQWLQIFIKFFEMPVPMDLMLKESMLSFERLQNNTFYQLSTYSNYYNHPYEKCRKWGVRCITRIMQLYGRPEYCLENLKPIAKFFLENYASKFMKCFYISILRAYTEKQFVYFKTLSPAVRYLQLCTHYGHLFSILLEQNQQPLDDLVFNRLFKLICYNPDDISLWKDNPHDFVERNFNKADELLDIRWVAVQTFEDLVCIRTDFVLEKVLKFCLDIVKKSVQAHECFRNNENNKNNGQMSITKEKYYEIMTQRDGVFHMLGAVANPLRRYRKGQMEKDLKQLFQLHILKDFKSPIGFLRARACWMVGRFYRMHWSPEEYDDLTQKIIASLNDREIPVKLEASTALGRLATVDAGLATIKKNMDQVLNKYIELIDELGFDKVITLFDLLVDRLEQDFTPRAKNIMEKLLHLFINLQKKINEYISKNLCKEGKNEKGEKINESRNVATSYIMMESEEREKEEEEAFDNNFASANQILRCINTVLFSAINVPTFLAQLEELVKPLLIDFFDRPKLYEMHAQEFFDMIHTLSFYSEPLSRFLWQLYSKVIEAYLEVYNDEFNLCVKILCNFINAAAKQNKDFMNVETRDLMEELLIFAQAAINDSNADRLFIGVLFETLYSRFKFYPKVQLRNYNPRVMEMCMSKYSTTDNQKTQSAMLGIVCLISFTDPEQFLRMLHAKNKVHDMLDLINKEFKEMSWPQQRCVIFSFSTILTLEPHQLPQSLHPSRLIQLAVDLVNYILLFNYEEEADFEDDAKDEEEFEESEYEDDDAMSEDGKSNNNMSDSEDRHKKMQTGKDDDERSEKYFTERDAILNLGPNKDYINEDDAAYAEQMNDEENPKYIDEILETWQNDNNMLPRTAFDEMNEVVYFHDMCLKQFSERFPQLFEKWKQSCKPECLELLKKHLTEGRKSMKKYVKRKQENAQSEQEKKETVINLLNNHQTRTNFQ